MACTSLANNQHYCFHFQSGREYTRATFLWQNSMSAVSNRCLLTSTPSSVSSSLPVPPQRVALTLSSDEPIEHMQQLRLRQEAVAFSAPASALVSGKPTEFQPLLPSASPLPLPESSPRRQQVFDGQQWPRSLGDLLVADQEIDQHERTLGATLREFMHPQVHCAHLVCLTLGCRVPRHALFFSY